MPYQTKTMTDLLNAANHQPTQLGDLLLEAGAINSTQLQLALQLQQQQKQKPLGQILIDSGCIKPRQLRRSLTRQSRLRHTTAVFALSLCHLPAVAAEQVTNPWYAPPMIKSAVNSSGSSLHKVYQKFSESWHSVKANVDQVSIVTTSNQVGDFDYQPTSLASEFHPQDHTSFQVSGSLPNPKWVQALTGETMYIDSSGKGMKYQLDLTPESATMSFKVDF